MQTKRFTVQLCRIEHNVYEIEVEAESVEAAEDIALEIWADDDEAFTDMGCVHAEEYIHEVKRLKGAA